MNEKQNLKKDIVNIYGSVNKFARANNLDVEAIRSFFNSKSNRLFDDTLKKISDYREMLDNKKEDPDIITESDIYFINDAILLNYKSVADFCKKCNFSQSEVSQFLRGNRKRKNNKYHEILNALA